MPIPKIIYQTFKTGDLPLVNRLAVKWLKFRNPGYRYEFYDDNRIIDFLRDAYPPEILKAYNRLFVGAGKADFFRYAVLYKTGGVYLDMDAYIPGKLSKIIQADDVAVISKERFPNIYVQWAMIYEAGHPFLEKTIERVVKNIHENAYPYSGHGMTGPTAYSQSIIKCLEDDAGIPYRLFGTDYNGKIKSRLPFSRQLYKGMMHWKEIEKTTPVLKPEEE